MRKLIEWKGEEHTVNSLAWGVERLVKEGEPVLVPVVPVVAQFDIGVPACDVEAVR